MLRAEQIGSILCPEAPNVYAQTNADVKLLFEDGCFLLGQFEQTERSAELANENKFTFIKKNDSQNFKRKRDQRFVTIIDADKLIEIEYPSYRPLLRK